ncbi:hypothetical protein ACZ90_25155 [Streptomyces albus subsp. albus]|nr:hypothetical protein ACZ90_25155 [Streptomyces albus subsp. albus]
MPGCASRSPYAAGHLGELTRIVTPALVDEVLAVTRRTQVRVRKLPSRVVVYFVLAMALFSECGYLGVWDSMTAGLGRQSLPRGPSAAALRQARRRIGTAPLSALFDRLRGAVATPSDPSAYAWGLHLVAWDATTLETSDTAANAAFFGRARGSHAAAGYPMTRLSALVECGTRTLLDAVFGPLGEKECGQAVGMLRSVRPGMLVLADRGYERIDLMRQVIEAGAHLLWRMKARPLPAIDMLPDGSYLAFLPLKPWHGDRLRAWLKHGRTDIPPQIRGVAVRVVDANITSTGPDGQQHTAPLRLITTLLDPDHYPAADLARLYHERWEIETAFYGLKVTLRGADRVLRSGDPDGVRQEVYAFLITYQATQIIAAQAAHTARLDPDRLSFTVALRTARLTVITTDGTSNNATTSKIAAALLDPRNLYPAKRRSRTSGRAVKRPLSPFAHQSLKVNRRKHKVKVTVTAVIAPETLTVTAAP